MQGLRLLTNQGGGTFVSGPPFAVAATASEVIAVDLDVDGVLDVASISPETGAIGVGRGLGGGVFQPLGAVSVGDSPASIATSDLDLDGLPDLVVANAGSDEVALLLGLGGGDLAPTSSLLAGASPSSVAAADLNGDGSPDLVVTLEGEDAVAVLLSEAPPSALTVPVLAPLGLVVLCTALSGTAWIERRRRGDRAR